MVNDYSTPTFKYVPTALKGDMQQPMQVLSTTKECDYMIKNKKMFLTPVYKKYMFFNVHRLQPFWNFLG